MNWHGLASLNALLNALSACLLIIGLLLIRRRNIAAHRRTMIAAFITSSLFLVSYVVHHLRVGAVYFQGHGWSRIAYFAVLGTHTPLAALIVPLALATLVLALRGRYAVHRRWARWTLPIWIYVSVTGVIVYLMLYRA